MYFVLYKETMLNKMSISNADVTSLADEIESYLRHHPHAADTVEGIATWWILKQRRDISSDLVQQALDYLVLTSVMDVKKNLSGQKVYSRKAKT